MRNTFKILIWLCSAVAAFGQTEMLRTADSVADLLARYRPDGAYKKIVLLGYYSRNDGGGGILYGTNTVTSTNFGTRIYSGYTGLSWERQIDGPMTMAMFGTKGDLTTDDRARAQNCLDVAAARNVEVKIAGNFQFQSSLYLTNNAILTSFGETVNLMNGDNRTFIAQGITNLTLRGIHFTSTNGNNNQSPIRLFNVKDSKLEDIRLDGAQLDGIEVSGCERIVLRRFEVNDADDFGIFFYNSLFSGLDGLKARNCRVFSFELKDDQHSWLRNFDVRGVAGHKLVIWTGEDSTTTPGPRVSAWNLLENGYVEGTTTNSQHSIYVQSSPYNTVKNVRVKMDGVVTWAAVAVGGGNGFWNDQSAMTCNTTSGSATVASVSNIGQLKVGDRIRIGDVDGQTSFVIQSINTGAGTFVVDKLIGTTATGKLIGWASQSHGTVLEDVYVDGVGGTGVDAILIGGQASDDWVKGVVLTRCKVANSAHDAIVSTWADFTLNDFRAENVTDRAIDVRNSKMTATRLFARGGNNAVVITTNSIATLIAPDIASTAAAGLTITPSSDASTFNIFGGSISNCVGSAITVNSNSIVSGMTIVGSRLGAGSFSGQVQVFGQKNMFINNIMDKGSSTWLDSHFSEQTGATDNLYQNSYLGGLANNVIFATGSTSTRFSLNPTIMGWADAMLRRSAAGQVQVTDNAGADADLKLRNITSSGAIGLPAGDVQTQLNTKGYTITLTAGGNGGGVSPADSTTYYFGTDTETMLHTVYANASIRIPKTGTVKAAYFHFIKNVTGSGENITLAFRLNDTTDLNLTTTMTWSATADKVYSTGLSQAVTAGDTFTMKLVTPAWVTNPTGVRGYGWIYIE
jgi:hypothetical protein